MFKLDLMMLLSVIDPFPELYLAKNCWLSLVVILKYTYSELN